MHPAEPAMPPRVSLAAIATIVSGALQLAGALFVLLIFGTVAAFLAPQVEEAWPFALAGGILFVVAFLPIVVGALTLYAGLRLRGGARDARGFAFAMNIVTIVLSIPGMAFAGAGLLTLAASGVAVWALMQPEAQAWAR